MTVTRETPVGWGNGNLFFFFSFSYFCCCCWLFFWLSLSTFFKTCPFFYYSIFIIIIIIIDCLFQTANFSWTESRTSKLFRRAELIQTPIIIPVEFKSKGENAHFGQTGYKMPCNDLCLWNIILKCVYMKSLFSEFFGHWSTSFSVLKTLAGSADLKIVSQNMVSFSEPSVNKTLNLRSIKHFRIAWLFLIDVW